MRAHHLGQCAYLVLAADREEGLPEQDPAHVVEDGHGIPELIIDTQPQHPVGCDAVGID